MFKKQAVAAALIFSSSIAQAELIDYSVTLQVESVTNAFTVCPTGPRHLFGCNITPGNTFTGRFAVDDALLSRQGTNLNAKVYNFSMQMGTVNWDQNARSDFAGFRYFAEWAQGGLVQNSTSILSFNVDHGQITALTGGVFGGGDFPFVDFYNTPQFGHFFAHDDGITALSGTLSVQPDLQLAPSFSFARSFGFFEEPLDVVIADPVDPAPTSELPEPATWLMLTAGAIFLLLYVGRGARA
jgi:hypothetical protein